MLNNSYNLTVALSNIHIKVGVHALRHTYATRLFEKRVDIKVISELLGHSSTEITYKVYIHVIDSLKESAVEAIDLD